MFKYEEVMSVLASIYVSLHSVETVKLCLYGVKCSKRSDNSTFNKAMKLTMKDNNAVNCRIFNCHLDIWLYF